MQYTTVRGRLYKRMILLAAAAAAVCCLMVGCLSVDLPADSKSGSSGTGGPSGTTDTGGSATGQETEPTSGSTRDPDDIPYDPNDVEKLSAMLVVNDAAYEYYNFVRTQADRYKDLINAIGDRLAGKAAVYDMIIPSSMDIMLPSSLRDSVNSSNQKDAIAYMYGNMNSNVTTLSIYNTLREHNNEYIYFRTDHHWTALGAYYGYLRFTEKKGVAPLDLGAWNKVEYPGFLGSFYNEVQKPAMKSNPDTVVAYKPPYSVSMTYTDKQGAEHEWPLLSDVSGWAASGKYNTFVAGDQPFTHIRNKDKSDGTSCVVIKESYGNALIPFLVEHYENIYVVDYRYWGKNLYSFVEQNGVQDVLLLNNISMTRSSSLIDKLESITK